MITHPGAHRQLAYSVGLDWGPTGADALAARCDIAVVVDVLSFTTTLSVAADRGTVVVPFPWRDERATRVAAELGATLAVGRTQARDGQVSLSPHRVRTAAFTDRLLLPSPNGSTISARLAQDASEVIGVSLRNRQRAARWLGERRAAAPALTVAVIAAGERWPDNPPAGRRGSVGRRRVA